MIALMENAALKTVLPYLGDDYTTVGFEVNIRHLKPTPVGMQVECIATLIEVDGKKLVFKLEASDEEGKIGEGTHTRYIIDSKKFMNFSSPFFLCYYPLHHPHLHLKPKQVRQ